MHNAHIFKYVLMFIYIDPTHILKLFQCFIVGFGRFGVCIHDPCSFPAEQRCWNSKGFVWFLVWRQVGSSKIIIVWWYYCFFLLFANLHFQMFSYFLFGLAETYFQLVSTFFIFGVLGHVFPSPPPAPSPGEQQYWNAIGFIVFFLFGGTGGGIVEHLKPFFYTAFIFSERLATETSRN